MRPAGTIAWITGASAGIGAACARELVRRGARVYGTARSRDRLEDLAATLGGFSPLPGDVTDLAAMRAAAADIVAREGRLDLLVANAGVWRSLPLHRFSAEAVAATLEVNVTGAANCIDAVLPHMLERGRGTIAGVASLAGYRGLPGAAAYSASKAALIALLESLRIDAPRHGLRVVTINPAFVDTAMTARNRFPMPFMVDAERAGRAIVDGLEHGHDEIAFPLPMVAGAKLMRLLPVRLHAELFRRFGRGVSALAGPR